MPWPEDLKFPRGYQMGTHIEKKLFFKYYISVNKAFLRLEEFGIDTNTSEGITDSKIGSANHF